MSGPDESARSAEDEALTTQDEALTKQVDALTRQVGALTQQVGALTQQVGVLRAELAELGDRRHATSVATGDADRADRADHADRDTRALQSRRSTAGPDPAHQPSHAVGLDVRPSDPLGEPRAVIAALLSAALEPVDAGAPPWRADEASDTPFDRFRACFHPDRRGTHVLDTSLLRFAWPRLRRTAASYLRDASDPSSFVVARSAPSAPTPQTDELKVFLRADGRMPVPVGLRRDRGAGGHWRIDSVSL